MRTTLFIAVISLFFFSCTKIRLVADGNIRTEVRNTGVFTGVSGSGSNPIKITYGNEFKVEVRGSGNLIPRYKTNIHNGTLNLGYEFVSIKNDDIEVFVTMPEINNASMSGSGRLDINGNFPAQNIFRLTISGSSKTNVNDIFNADEINVNISGSGDANLEKILSNKADVKISGSGNVRLSVQNALRARISGSGKIFYTGNPVIDSETSGSGSVVKF